jgi:hypothetical protein
MLVAGVGMNILAWLVDGKRARALGAAWVVFVIASCGGKTKDLDPEADGGASSSTGGAGEAGNGGTGIAGNGAGGSPPSVGGALGTGASGAGRGGNAGSTAGRGGANGQGGVNGRGGGAGVAAGCAGDFERCAVSEQCCGYTTGRNRCIDTPALGRVCLYTCTAPTDCPSGCCSRFDDKTSVCGPPSLCGNCVQDLEPCLRNEDCCGFATGDNVCADTGSSEIGVACLLVCNSAADCPSGCCTTIDGSGNVRVCAPASRCPP